MSDVRAEVGWLLWCLDQGYSNAADRAVTGNWLLDDEATLTPQDRDCKADLLDMADEIIPVMLAPIRAEVERLRDTSVPWQGASNPRIQAEIYSGTYIRRQAFKEVLDLIDKHTREGQ